MISIYDIGNTRYTGAGNAIMMPTACTITEEAGGSYELDMNHPIDETGKWEHIVCGALIKAPVPVAEIENAFVGMDVDVYKADMSAPMRENPVDDQTISYQAWVEGTMYPVGARVTYQSKNWQNVEATTETTAYDPPGTTSKWIKIQRTIPGAAILTTLAAGTEIYLVETSGNWIKASTKYGITGYVKKNQVSFVRHETVQPVTPRQVEDQLFRIYHVEKSSSGHNVTCRARHVSYDLAGLLTGDCNLSLVSPAMAIMRIKDALMVEYSGQIATNLTEENGTYTGDVTNKNGIYAFLDPDKGIIPHFRAKLMRDNWDLFLMKNDTFSRGMRISYGKNMLGVTWKQDTDKIVTRVVPVAKDASGNELYLNGDTPWVESDQAEDYPVIRMERLKIDAQVGKDDGAGSTWTKERVLAYMEEQAQKRFDVDHADAVTTQLDVQFQLLGDTEEYKQYKGLEKLYMYDWVLVHDSRMGLDMKLQVRSITWDAIRRKYTGIGLGDVYDYGARTVSAYQIGDGAIDYSKISNEAVRRIISEVQV